MPNRISRLCKETIAVCYENHLKHINVPCEQNIFLIVDTNVVTAVFSKVNYRVLLFLGCLLREHGACSLR